MRRFALILAPLLAACGPAPSAEPDDDTPTTDAAPGAPDGPGGPAADARPAPESDAVYAHTSQTLFRVDPETLDVTEVGDFGWPAGAADSMTDIAIDKNGVMIGVSFGKVYRIDPTTAQTSVLSASLQGNFNGLSFVPAEQLGRPPGPDVLVGSRNTDGVISEIDPSTGEATPVGDMGGNWVSSGDIVSVAGFGTVATVTTAGSQGHDVLARLAPGTFEATPIGSDTGADDLWGIGFWKGKVFGFSTLFQLVLIDTTTGAATPVGNGGQAWWGAAVTTTAPIID